MSRILLIEDDEGDVFLLTEAFRACGPGVVIEAVGTGEAGFEKLRTGESPDIIIMDLNLPGPDGCEVAQELKKDKRFKTIPVLMLTTSQAQSDVERAYRCGINAFLVKPMDLDQLELMAKRICAFWFSAVRLARP